VINNDNRDFSQHASDGGTTGGVAVGGSGSGSTAAGQAVIAGEQATVGTSGANVNTGIAHKVKGAPWWAKLSAVLGVLLTIGTIVAFVTHKTDAGVAGLVLAVIAIGLAAVTVFA
jgi:hypothetical protein